MARIGSPRNPDGYDEAGGALSRRLPPSTETLGEGRRSAAGSSRVATFPHRDRQHRFLFVLDAMLDGGGYVPNLERSLSQQSWLDVSVIMIEQEDADRSSQRRPPGSWSWKAGRTARSLVNDWLPQHPSTEAVFIHLHAASCLGHRAMHRVPTVISLDATPRNYDSVLAHYVHRRHGPLIDDGSSGASLRAYRAAVALIAWSHWGANSLISDYGVHPPKVHVIRPGVDLGLFHPINRRPAAGPVRVLFVADDFVRRGGPDVLAAMGRLSELAELDIVTDSDVGPLQAGLTCRVHRGIAPNSAKLVQLYQRADVFALPSRGEVFGMAVAEAMACGLPIVATDTGAIPEMVADGVNGFLVPPRQPAPLGRALEALIETPSLRLAMGVKSLGLAKREHDVRVNNEAILQLLVEAVPSRSARSST